MKIIFSLILTILLFVALPACKRNPVNRLANPTSDGIVSLSTGTYVLYDDELKTGGGNGFIPGGENQSIDLADRSNPARTLNAIRYSWSGADVYKATGADPGFQHLYAGFSLLITPDNSTVDAATPRDFSTAGYTKLKMFVRGTLSSDTKLRIEGPGNDIRIPARVELDSTQLTSNWQEITLNVPTTDFSSVKEFMTISFQYSQPPRSTEAGNGGVIYLDDIRYEK